MVDAISHDIAFGMYHVGCKYISYDKALCFFAIWYVF